jgi:DNA polymerase-1
MKLLALDANSILNRAFYGVKPLTTKSGQFTNGIYGFLNILFKLLEEVHPDGVAIAFDRREPTFRHRMYDGYKAQRKGMPEELAGQLEPLKALLEAMGYRILDLSGYEADDILGTLAQQCSRTGSRCVIATGDRDSLQLVDENVTVLLASTKMGRPESTVYDTQAVRDKYGVEPARLVDVKALMGDASDNIPGVAGIGEKTALALIGEFGTLEALYEKLAEADLRAGVRDKLEKGRETAFMSRRLAEIDRSVPLDIDLSQLVPAAMDKSAVYSQLSRLELSSIIRRLALSPEDASNDSGAAPGASSAPADTAAFSFGAADSFEKAGNASALSLVCGFEGDEIVTAAVCADGQTACLDHSHPRFAPLLAALLAGNGAKRTVDLKKIYAYGYKRQIDIQNVVFDAELAAYLLNPNASGYALRQLATGLYGLPLPRCGDENADAALGALAADACLLGPVCDRLEDDLQKTGQLSLLREIELPLCRVLASMERVGFRLDTAGLAAFGVQLDSRLEELTARIHLEAGGGFNLNSPQQLAGVLFERLGLPARKKTKSGFSTDAEVLDSLRGLHPIVEDILEYRKLAKLKSTYVEGLLRLVGDDGRVRTSFRQTETRTGRISSTEPNLQNIPVRTELGSELRKFFVAGEGQALVDADYSQIELRVLAHIARDDHMIEAFTKNEDIHTLTAAQVFGMPPSFVTPQMRSRAKAVNFGIVYGIGAFSLSQDIGVSVAEADRYIKSYLQSYSGVRQYMQDTVAAAKQNGYVATLYGRRRPVPELTAQNRATRQFGERVAMNTPIQGTAADIIKLAMIRVFDRLKAENIPARLILQVHDELIVECDSAAAAEAARILREEMEAAATLSVPLLADVGTGQSWYDAK